MCVNHFTITAPTKIDFLFQKRKTHLLLHHLLAWHESSNWILKLCFKYVHRCIKYSFIEVSSHFPPLFEILFLLTASLNGITPGLSQCPERLSVIRLGGSRIPPHSLPSSFPSVLQEHFLTCFWFTQQLAFSNFLAKFLEQRFWSSCLKHVLHSPSPVNVFQILR